VQSKCQFASEINTDGFSSSLKAEAIRKTNHSDELSRFKKISRIYQFITLAKHSDQDRLQMVTQ